MRRRFCDLLFGEIHDTFLLCFTKVCYTFFQRKKPQSQKKRGKAFFLVIYVDALFPPHIVTSHGASEGTLLLSFLL